MSAGHPPGEQGRGPTTAASRRRSGGAALIIHHILGMRPCTRLPFDERPSAQAGGESTRCARAARERAFGAVRGRQVAASGDRGDPADGSDAWPRRGAATLGPTTAGEPSLWRAAARAPSGRSVTRPSLARASLTAPTFPAEWRDAGAARRQRVPAASAGGPGCGGSDPCARVRRSSRREAGYELGRRAEDCRSSRAPRAPEGGCGRARASSGCCSDTRPDRPRRSARRRASTPRGALSLGSWRSPPGTPPPSAPAQPRRRRAVGRTR